MITQTEPRIILEGITVNDFLLKLERYGSTIPSAVSRENFNVEQAAEFIGLSVPSLHRLKATNQVPYKKIGGRLVFVKSELSDWLKKTRHISHESLNLKAK
jgi:predicted DNA-binding transcriptional regulator AlpA